MTSRQRPLPRQSTSASVRGSRVFGSSIGMGRYPVNSQSPKPTNRFDTPQKKLIGPQKPYASKKAEFDPTQYMVPQCSVRDIEIYKQMFDFLDEDHDGNLTPLDLRKCIRQFGGYNPGRKFVYIAMSVFDSDDGGQIDFRQFIQLLKTKPYEKDTEDDLIRVFESLDEDGKGYIDESDILKLAEQMKQEVTLQEIREAISYAAPQGKTQISFREFVKFSRRKDYD